MLVLDEAAVEGGGGGGSGLTSKADGNVGCVTSIASSRSMRFRDA